MTKCDSVVGMIQNVCMQQHVTIALHSLHELMISSQGISVLLHHQWPYLPLIKALIKKHFRGAQLDLGQGNNKEVPTRSGHVRPGTVLHQEGTRVRCTSVRSDYCFQQFITCNSIQRTAHQSTVQDFSGACQLQIPSGLDVAGNQPQEVWDPLHQFHHGGREKVWSCHLNPLPAAASAAGAQP